MSKLTKDEVICIKCKKALPEGWKWLLTSKYKNYKITCPDCLEAQNNLIKSKEEQK